MHVSIAAIRRPVTQLQVLLVLAIALGGGGISYGLRHALIQLVALAILAANPGVVRDFVAKVPRSLLALVLLSMLLPLLQVVPLPPAIWQMLPGREIVARSHALLGLPAGSWHPFSLNPARTLLAFCSTLVPATMIVMGWHLSRGDRRLLAVTLVATAAACFALGAVQLTSANSFGILQDIAADPDTFYATFSNRNSTGMFFLLALLVAIALPVGSRRFGLLALAIAGVLFLLAVFLTQSRTSMVLTVLPLALLVLRLGAQRLDTTGLSHKIARPANLAITAAALMVGLLLAGWILTESRISESLGRFTNLEMDRLEAWEDGAYTTQVYWPAGAGTGTYDDVSQVYESLEFVYPARSGRAHNDYVELAIETGLGGYLLLLGWFARLAMACWQRRRDTDRWLAFAAWTGCVALALQSALDYPLRSEALLCVAALLIVFLLPPREEAP